MKRLVASKCQALDREPSSWRPRQDSNLRRTVLEADRGAARTLQVARERTLGGEARQSVFLLVLREATVDSRETLDWTLPRPLLEECEPRGNVGARHLHVRRRRST